MTVKTGPRRSAGIGTTFAHIFSMSEIITIHPPQETVYDAPNLSPHQAKMPHAPNIVNDEFFGSFADILDTINPLQHIPGVSTIYRALTGETISHGAKIAGDTLFGGPLGLLSSIVGSIFEEETGKDVGGHLMAAATGNYEKANNLIPPLM